MRIVTRPLVAIAFSLLGAFCAEPAAIAQQLNQIQLTDQQVAAFIAAQKDFAPLSTRLLEGGDKPDEALTKELETIAKKHAFKSFAEFEDVGANITIILDGLDRSTGAYTDPIEKMKKELEEIKADEFDSGGRQEACHRRSDAGDRRRPAAEVQGEHRGREEAHRRAREAHARGRWRERTPRRP